MAATVFVDYAQVPRVPGMRVCGMTVAERVLREAARAGATRAVIRGELPELPALPIEITRGDPPPDAEEIDGTRIAGIAISDEPSRRRASRALLQSCRRSYDGLGDRYVIRAVSLRLSAMFCALGVTPNQITWGNIALGYLACGVAAHGNFAIAGILMFVQAVLDSCDGEVARLRHLSSRFGMWLDNTSDDVIDNAFVAALGVGLGGAWLYVGIITAVAKLLVALMIHVDVARRGKPGDIMAFKWFFDTAGEDLADRFETRTSLAGIGRAAGRRDFYILVWTITCLAGIPWLGLVHGALVAAVYFGLAVAHVIVSGGYRRRRSGGPASRS